MAKLLQINVNRNIGSTGRITEEIGRHAIAKGWESYIAAGRFSSHSESRVIEIGSGFHVFLHGLETRFFDRHGLGSKYATTKLVEQIKVIKPDIIHLHNLHGYYLNIEVLFGFLSKSSISVVWTLHDCWSITGHCAYFDHIACNKWKTECNRCPQKTEYPASIFFDRSKENYYLKKSLFTSVDRMVIVPVSDWLKNIVLDSFMKYIPVQTIHNGIDTDIFKPQSNHHKTREKYKIGERFMLLGVASPWSKRKGLKDFINLSKLLNKDEVIVLIGLDFLQIKELPDNIIRLTKTKNIQELIDLYSAADLFINPTWEDNFPTTNIESLSCGTPVVTYRTGGSIEAISSETGFVVEKGDITGLVEVIKNVKKIGKYTFSGACRQRAIDLYSKNDCFSEYFELYEKLLSDNPK